MSPIYKTKKYQKFSEFIDEMNANNVFEKIKDTTENSSIEWKDKDKDLTWRLKKCFWDNGFEEYRLSCFNVIPNGISKKEHNKQKIAKTCWIYREPYTTTEKYIFSKKDFCITGIDLKSWYW
jgi:hypothetical protein